MLFQKLMASNTRKKNKGIKRITGVVHNRNNITDNERPKKKKRWPVYIISFGIKRNGHVWVWRTSKNKIMNSVLQTSTMALKRYRLKN
jgi:hypothetical protein